MHQHPRPPPVSASPASSPRTNPTRTNNPREESSSLRVPADTSTYNEGDEGSGDSGVMTGPSKDAVKKLDQIIQVCPTIVRHWNGIDICLQELPYKGCSCRFAIKNVATSGNHKRRHEEGQQMGELHYIVMSTPTSLADT